MLVYEIDGSKEGLLCAIFFAFKNKEKPDLVVTSDDCFQTGFLTSVKKIVNSATAVKRVDNAIRERLTTEKLKEFSEAFFSGSKDKNTVIFNFAYLLMEKGSAASDMMANPVVLAYNDMIYGLWHETHLLRGFLRFKQTQEGYMYAQIKPENDCLTLLMPHFVERYKCEVFAIHDIRRNKIGLYNSPSFKIVQLDTVLEVTLSEEEAFFGSLWKEYYRNLSIKERTNRKLQRNLMPHKFRAMMDETYEVFETFD